MVAREVQTLSSYHTARGTGWLAGCGWLWLAGWLAGCQVARVLQLMSAAASICSLERLIGVQQHCLQDAP
jgi:hypothetical protein